MCHLYRLRIKTHVLNQYHALCYRATWWQLGLNSKEDICVSLCQLLVSAGGAGPSQTPSIAIRRRPLHCGSARSTAGDSGNSDTRTTLRLYHSIKREYIDRVSGS